MTHPPELSKHVPVIFIIGFVWPEPRSSAAGFRTLSLIESFLSAGWKVCFSSTSPESEYSRHLVSLGVETYNFAPNDSAFDLFIGKLKPDFVLFDRFMIEEQFGWRVRENSPTSVLILDTVDLHFLRRRREEDFLKGPEAQKENHSKLISEATLREIASLFRSDCSLVLSDFERSLLMQEYQVPNHLLYLSRFHYGPPQPCKSFLQRRDFVFIGNFRHRPNSDAVNWLAKEIWPLIRKDLPDAKLYVYGAYPTREIMRLTDEDSGLYVMGSTEDQFQTLGRYRVNLAPLRFGAGIKGKISDGWWTGTPVVSTTIGAEGMNERLPWGGEIDDTAEDFAKKAVLLYTDESRWNTKRENGFQILRELYSIERNSADLLSHFLKIKENLPSIRSSNLIGAILNHHFHKSTKYFSKWIEEKNKKNPSDLAL